MSAAAANLINQKSILRKLMKETLKQLSVDEKARQSNILIDYLINKCERFKKSKHIALYLAMIHEEVNTIPLIEHLLSNKEKNEQQHIYVPHVPWKSTNDDQMVFYELKSMKQYREEMNENNRFKLRQFNNVEIMEKADETLFDLIIVPGLAFDSCELTDQNQIISRLGRGKGYYDKFLVKIPSCYTIGVGFNQQYLPLLNQELKNDKKESFLRLTYDKIRDKCLNEFICEKLI
jgi:5-formyltetrahydrofolate cyclo-ligase